jgi:arsenical pump membrane protein
MMQSLAAFSIFALTVGAALGRPRLGRLRIGHAEAAVAGALIALAAGVVSVDQVLSALESLALPVITIVSLMAITLVAEAAGMLRLLAHRMALAAAGDARKLFLYIFAVGTLAGTMFTNDTAVLILTPLVFRLVEDVQEKNWTLANKIPFYFAVLYVGNLVGAFVISNPINLVVSSLMGIGFIEYAAWMILPALASMVVSFAGLRWFFRDTLPLAFVVPEAATKPRVDRGMLRACTIVLCLTLVGFFGEGLIGLPVWLVAGMGAAALATIFRLKGHALSPIVRGIGWDVIIFVVGMFIIVIGLRNQGFAEIVGNVIQAIGGTALPGLAAATGFVAAICSAIFNNHPTAGLMVWVIGDFGRPTIESNLLVYAALIGGDLGPKMLPIGSLAALMWFRMLRSRGVHVPYGLYIRIGVPVTLAATALSLVTLILEWWIYQHFLQ